MPAPLPLAITEHEAAGAPNATPVVVLVHGSLDRSDSFARVLRRLDDLHTVVYDRRGYHRSRPALPLERWPRGPHRRPPGCHRRPAGGGRRAQLRRGRRAGGGAPLREGLEHRVGGRVRTPHALAGSVGDTTAGAAG